MPKQKQSTAHPTPPRLLKHPWPVVFIILFFILLAGILVLLYAGIAPAYDSFTRGYTGLYMQPDAGGQVVLSPQPGGGALRAGVEDGDILLAIDGVPLEAGQNPNDLLGGRVGEPVSITVLKGDGSQQTYTIIRSESAQNDLEQAGLTADALAYYFIALSVLRILIFAAAGLFVLLRRPQDWLFVLAAYALLFFPLGFNYADLVSNGAVILGLGWLVFLTRTLGIFLAFTLLVFFPNGKFVSDWTRLLLILAAFWLFPYVAAQFVTDLIPYNTQGIVWGIFFLLAIAFLAYRLLRASTRDEVRQSRPVVTAFLVFAGVFLLIKGLSLLPADTFDGAGWTWYYMITALPVDAALAYLAIGLAISMRRIGQ